ncbi:hypothetical protein C8Q78DRAFT_299820 [Trametes maxima]|nr:hypothetical protein C8Q78DRAFT_299820 [Trametes maxima]
MDSAAAPPNSTAGIPIQDIPLDALFPGVAIDNTFGAILLGTFLGLTLFGLNLHQTFRYFRLFPNDAPLLRTVVFLTLALETMHTIMGIHICYFYLVTSYFNPLALKTGVWSIKLLSLNMGAVMFVSQSFFARRVYLIGKHQRYMAVVTSFFLLGELAFATAATAETYIQVTFERFVRVSWLISVGYSMAVCADGMVAICLTMALRRSRANHARNDSLLDVILVYAINTGLLTSVFSLIFVTVYNNNLIYVGFNTVATRLYANSLLAVLNSRRSLVDRGAEGFETGSLGLSLYQAQAVKAEQEQWNVPQLPPPQPKVIDIKVTTEMVRDAAAACEPEDVSDVGSQKGEPLHM